MAKPPILARMAAIRTLAAGNLMQRPAMPVQPGDPDSKIGPISTDRNRAQSPQPASKTGQGDIRSSITTYFTKVPQAGAGPTVLYSGDRLWARVIVTLETAGPVAVGFSSDLAPVASGKGILLTTGDPITFDVAKGNQIYILATGVNRVKLQVQPLPWLEQIAGLMRAIFGGGQ